MKNYRLSEIKEECSQHKVSCVGCEFNTDSKEGCMIAHNTPAYWEIDKPLFKRYALLEDNTIEPLYYDYDNNEERWIEEEDGELYLMVDRWNKDYTIQKLLKLKIIKQSDNKEDLEEIETNYAK